MVLAGFLAVDAVAVGSAQDKIGVGESVWLYFSNLIKIKIKKHKNVSFAIDSLDIKCYNIYI